MHNLVLIKLTCFLVYPVVHNLVLIKLNPVLHNLVLIKLTGFLVHPVGPVEYNLVIMLIIPG